MYEISDEVKEIAEPIIAEFHRHLLEAKITYLFRDVSWKKTDGKTILGKAAKRNEIDKLLSDRKEDFIIIVGKDRWEKMLPEEKRCLVDHELAHCGVLVSNSGERKWMLRDHPIAEFPENLKRFEFRRKLLGELIENPPSAIVSKPVPFRKIRLSAEDG